MLNTRCFPFVSSGNEVKDFLGFANWSQSEGSDYRGYVVKIGLELFIAALLFANCNLVLAQTLPTSGEKGNFHKFESIIKPWFIPKGNLKGFSAYENKVNKLNSLLMRSSNGYCCEGLIMVQPMEDDELIGYLMFLYSPLQESLRLNNRESVNTHFKERVAVLCDQLMTNLKQSNRTEFAFDHLNVRGEIYPVSDAEYKAGKTPMLMVKLWSP